MTIPKGSEFTFNVTIIEKDSFLPQDLTNIDLGGSSFKLVKLDTLSIVSGSPVIDVVDSVNGVIEVTLPSSMTSSLEYLRGDMVDNYYLKPVYEGVINVKFTDDTPERTAVVDKIYVVPIGV